MWFITLLDMKHLSVHLPMTAYTATNGELKHHLTRRIYHTKVVSRLRTKYAVFELSYITLCYSLTSKAAWLRQNYKVVILVIFFKKNTGKQYFDTRV